MMNTDNFMTNVMNKLKSCQYHFKKHYILFMLDVLQYGNLLHTCFMYIHWRNNFMENRLVNLNDKLQILMGKLQNNTSGFWLFLEYTINKEYSKNGKKNTCKIDRRRITQ